MTQVVIDDIIPRTQLVATAGQTVFNTNWTADADTDINVYARADGVEANDITQLVNPNLYNVTFVGGSETVRVTFLSGRTLNDVITIVRNTPAERLNLYTNTNFVPEMLNQDFGILTLVDQQAQMYDTVVAPHYNVSATIESAAPTPADVILPILDANQAWVMNPSRTAIIAYDLPSGGGVAPNNAEYLIRVANSELPNAQVMGSLDSGLVVNTTTTGVQLTRTLTGISNQTSITNGNGISGNPTIGLANNPIIPGNEGLGLPSGTTGQRPGSPSGTELRFNTTNTVLEYWDGSSWIELSESGNVSTITGTENQVLVNGTFGTPEDGPITLTLPQDIATTSAPTFDGFKDGIGNYMLKLDTTALGVNYVVAFNEISSDNPGIRADGPSSDIGITCACKGTADFQITTLGNTGITFNTGTTYQHLQSFVFGNTANARTTTFQDSDGTVAYLSDIPAAGITNINQNTSSATLAANSRYAINNGASLVTLTLPVSPIIGDTYIIVGGSSGGWTIAQNASQQCHIGSTATTSGVGGSISSGNQYDCITLTCVAANTFSGYSIQGTLTAV